MTLSSPRMDYSKDAVNIFIPNGTRLYIFEEMLIRWQVKTNGMDWVRLGFNVNLIYATLSEILWYMTKLCASKLYKVFSHNSVKLFLQNLYYKTCEKSQCFLQHYVLADRFQRWKRRAHQQAGLDVTCPIQLIFKLRMLEMEIRDWFWTVTKAHPCWLYKQTGAVTRCRFFSGIQMSLQPFWTWIFIHVLRVWN
jgi:hypothetical protein